MAKVIDIRERALQSRDAIELLSNKWRITVIHILREEPLRTNEIQSAIAEVSPKVLTQTLRGLERGTSTTSCRRASNMGSHRWAEA